MNYQSVICFQQSLNSYRQSGIALRKSGAIDFYYDFRLVEISEAIPNKQVYTAIDSDFTDLHFKCYERSDDPSDPYEKVVLYSCSISWKQRIGILSSVIQSEESIVDIRNRL